MIAQTDLFGSVNKTPATVNATRPTMNGKPVYTIPSKTVLNLESHFKPKLLCDGLTFSLDTACVYRCAFCYVPDMMRKQQPYLERHGVTGKHEDIVIRRANAVDSLREALAKPKARAIADKELVVYSSPLADVAGNMPMVRDTIEACSEILKQTKWHIRLLSKSNLLPKVAEGLCIMHPEKCIKERLIFGVSTGTLDDKLAQAFEEGTPLVSKRIASLHWLQDNGYRTYGMICPSLPQLDYSKFAREMAQAIRADRCEHVWGEVINLRGESFERTIKALSDAGHTWEVSALRRVAIDKAAWEDYARATFNAHVQEYGGRIGADGTPKLRFLQYPQAGSLDWWKSHINVGAILL
jgi:DNA repair photolyase